MNEQLLSMVRAMLISAGTAAATKYGVDQNLVPAIVGGLIALATAAEAVWAKRKQGIVNSAAKVATGMVVPPELAKNAPANVEADNTHTVVLK